MKKLLLLILISFPIILTGQNLQFHFDFGKARNGNTDIKREYLTTTLEFFKPDKLGSTFFFVDVNFNKAKGGASLAYFEIVRKFIIHKKSRLSLHLEYNDGTPDFMNSAWLAGFSYPVKIGKVSIQASLLYKAFAGSNSPDGQLTLVWNQLICKDKFLFKGVLDIWTQDKLSSNGKNTVFLSEPQIWYILSEHFSIGSEVEISKNLFTYDGDLEIMPTIAFKWVF